MKIISLSLSENLISELDRIVEERDYSSRSEAMRDAIRDLVGGFDENAEDPTQAVVILIYRQEMNVETRLGTLEHQFEGLIDTRTHRHIRDIGPEGCDYCFDSFLVSGQLKEIKLLFGKLRAIKGVLQAKIALVSFPTTKCIDE